jgi:hypothetical protein
MVSTGRPPGTSRGAWNDSRVTDVVTNAG